MNEMPIYQLPLNVVSDGISILRIYIYVYTYIYTYIFTHTHIVHIAQNTWELWIRNSTGGSGKYFSAC